MTSFLITLSLLILGMGLRRLPSIPDETGNVLNLFVITVSLPALVLLKIPRLPLSGNLWVPAVMPWLMLLLSAALVLLLSRLLHWGRSVTGCLLLLIPLGNTSFFGIPMVKSFFGEAAIPYALLYDQLGSFLALAIYGSLILALYGHGSQPSVRGVVKKVVTFPPFIALVFAFLLRPFAYPEAMVQLLEMLAATLVPLVMIAVGFQLQLKLGREVGLPLLSGLTIKLLLAPLVALLLCRIAGLDDEAVRVSIFEAAMPPMISAGALAILADLEPPLASALVGLGMIISFATLAFWYQVLA